MKKYPGIRTDRPTHIIRFFGDDWDDPIVSLCGSCNMFDNYLTHREIYGQPLVDDNEITISKDELEMHRANLCRKCANHPDLALMLLGDV